MSGNAPPGPSITVMVIMNTFTMLGVKLYSTNTYTTIASLK
jgi:hypothetical protein